jgi:hypothetical protein
MDLVIAQRLTDAFKVLNTLSSAHVLNYARWSARGNERLSHVRGSCVESIELFLVCRATQA